MYTNSYNGFRSSTPSTIRAPTIDTYHLVTTSDITFYQIAVEVKTHSHDSEIEGEISITNSCKVDFKIISTFLIPQKNTLVLISNSNKFGLFDLSGGRLKYYFYPEIANGLPFIVTDVAWVNQTSSLYFSCTDLPIQCFNFSTKRWDQPIEASIDYPDITKLAVSHCQNYLCFLTGSGSLYYHMFGANIIDKIEISKDKHPTLLRFTPTPQPYLVLGYPKGRIEVLNIEGEPLLKYQVKDYSTVIDISFSPKDHSFGLIVTSTGRIIQLNFDPLTITPNKAFLNKPVHNIHCGLEGHTLITSDFDNTIKILNRYDPSKLLASIKIETQFPISRFMPVRCRKWTKIIIEPEQTSPNASNSYKRRNTFASSPTKWTGSILPVSSPTSPTIRHNITTNSIRLNSYSSRPKSVQSYSTPFSPEKERKQTLLSNQNAIAKSTHSSSKSHLPKLESRISLAQSKSPSRSQRSESSSKSGDSSNREGSLPNNNVHHIFKPQNNVTNGYRSYRSRDRMGHSKSRSESSSLFKDDKISPSQASDSGHISEDLHYLEERQVSKNGSQISSNSKRTSSNYSESPPQLPLQLAKLNDSKLSILSPIQSPTPTIHSTDDENIHELALTLAQDKIEKLIEDTYSKIELRDREKFETYQALLLAQNISFQGQLTKLNESLEHIPKLIDEIQQLKEENSRLRESNNFGQYLTKVPKL
ncbi:hypothetical protein CONCODRAFT_20114 [Conidiobolus coronatus NRRL 28638]|uniref:WD40 repeat-like protein n=1 Tax=Conidiobolus coronatus (strain ATCC 28846 / CBS 209.66 / NRRL 28638) TaxID=796925 RepID=A0A137NVP7_CONC2|nr:hypothetical protein CONCODRAFT_20114 [Conidiobolus coronatus NRRL 28638]|eukprot:KXN66674.1 hypothetical protein CONCODRAFT_20114 [Conidiobolus coronatus NRRL 28638]